MAVVAPERHPSLATRRGGYAVAALVNLTALYLMNVWPGWDVVPFLTSATASLLPLVNASLIINVVVNLARLVKDWPTWRAAGDLVGAVVTLVVLIAFWRVFPFDFAGFDPVWALITRTVLFFALAGTGIAIVAAAIAMVRGERTLEPAGPGRPLNRRRGQQLDGGVFR